LFDGQGTPGVAVAGLLLLTGSNTAGIYVEDTANNSNAIAANDEEEMDFAIVSNGATASQTYYFRILQGGSEIVRGASPNTHPQVATAAASAPSSGSSTAAWSTSSGGACFVGRTGDGRRILLLLALLVTGVLAVGRLRRA